MPLPPRTPDLDALDLLVSVAETHSIGRAAAAHGITQPSASAKLARLERMLGVDLLERSPRGTTLTTAGEAITAWAHRVVDAAQALTDTADTLRERRRARLRVAASLTVAEYLLPTWMLSLRRRHPDLQIGVSVDNSEGVCDLIQRRQADIGFIETPRAPRGVRSAVVGTDELALVVAPSYPLASSRRPIRPMDLLNHPLLIRERGSGTRDTFVAALSRAIDGMPDGLPSATELGSTTMIVTAARSGGGIGVVSERAVADDVANGSLARLPVPGLDLRRELRAIWMDPQLGGLPKELLKLAGATSPRR